MTGSTRTLLERLQGGAPGGVEERAGLRLGVELEAIGGDPAVGAREHDVAGRDQPVLVGEGLDLVGEEGLGRRT